MKLQDCSIGSKVQLDLLVKSASIKTTKPPACKPYLSMELYDGTDTVMANNWDYGDNVPPIKNDILTVLAEITEWPAGTKQLKVLKQKPCDSKTIADFAPSGNVDIDAYMRKATEIAMAINNKNLHLIALEMLVSFGPIWREAPGAKAVHHAYIAGTLKHSVDVALKAKALASLIPGCNVELCTVGGLLHDIGKLWTYAVDGAVIDYTEHGNLLDHITLGITTLESLRNPARYEEYHYDDNTISILQHIIASHHGELEFGSPVTPRFLEAWIVHFADNIDAKAETIVALNAKCVEGAVYTEKDWTLGNRAMFTQEYVNKMIGG